MGLNIGFAGISDKIKSLEYIVLSETIGVEIIRRGHKMLSGGCSGGTTQFCAEGAKGCLKKISHSPHNEFRILSIVPDEQFAKIDCGQVLVCKGLNREQRRPLMVSLMDALITVAGGEETGTYMEGLACFEMGTPVVPIWTTGGASLKLWNEIKANHSKEEHYKVLLGSREWQKIGGDNYLKNQKALGRIAVAMVEELAGLKAAIPIKTKGKVFVIMPFREDFNPVWNAIQDIFKKKLFNIPSRLECARADERHVGKLTEALIRSIQEAPFLIADVTDNNPNVLFELGYGIGIGKKILLLNQSPGKSAVDLKNFIQIPYNLAAPNAINVLKENIVNGIRQLLDPGFNGIISK